MKALLLMFLLTIQMMLAQLSVDGIYHEKELLSLMSQAKECVSATQPY